ncbi:hypothetical protein ACE1ET_17705 [Saccharicrinis sp. FJH62]|uniref:hypothetical protein n=1 Tax=Saccharicrinis sp. FJH62 TaxID=3344657 RepID=UPI0035D4C301
MKQALQVILLILIVVMAYLVIASPMKKINFDKEKAKREEAVKLRLMDIRTAQIAYKEKYKHHTASFDTLINFIEKDSLPIVLKEGILTDSMVNAGMTEAKAIKLGLIVRDTSYIPVAQDLFGKDYAADSLRFVPYGDTTQFIMGAGSVTTASNVTLQVFEAKTPYEVYLHGLEPQEITNLKLEAEKYERYPGMKVGDLEEANNYAGNWE